MRPIIQYDLDEPPMAPLQHAIGPQIPAGPPPNASRPPAKKRKWHHPAQKSQPVQHWDDPGSTAVGVVYDEQEGGVSSTQTVAGSGAGGGAEIVSYADGVEEEECGTEYVVEGEGDVPIYVGADVEEEEEESRPLTHEEIWDDSALIDAWNSAEAEYEAYHGTSKIWKTDPVKRSPLWYNKPYTPPSKPKTRSKPPTAQAQPRQEGSEPEPDTAPLDFHTFVPTHDPSLADSSSAAATAPFFVPPPSTTMVSRDEAFSNALSAIYWSGYWTAVYHCQSQSSGQHNDGTAGVTEENEFEVDEIEDEQDLVPTQR